LIYRYGVDAMWQLLGLYLGWPGEPGRGRALGLGELKFTGQVVPTMKQLVYQVDVKRIIRSRLVLGIADGALFGDGRLLYRANDLQVALFRDRADGVGTAGGPGSSLQTYA